ncbi:MAG TPA: HEAT repeat domain-containing protein [Acidimicrobiia bacterium]|nr:HEAT repeat domain-containing protein [Acidimicrobiia bacterium]
MIDIRAGEGRMVAWMAVLFAVTQAGHGLGSNAADTLFFLRFGVEHLPLMILVSGLVLMLATLGYTVGLGRRGAAGWLAPLLAALSGMVLLERLGVATGWSGVYVAIWLGAQIAILLSYTAMWNAAGEVCTTRQAKRLFPLFATAGIGGGIVGNLLTGPLAATLGTENLLLVHAGLLMASALVTTTHVTRFFWRSDSATPTGILEDLRSGLALTRTTPLLKLMSWTAGAFSLLFFLVSFPFSAVVADSFSSEAEVAGFLGLFSAAATALTFLASFFLVNRLFLHIGVVATLLLVPLVYVSGFGSWLISFGLLSASIVRALQWVAVNAVGGTAWSALFNVIPGRRRSQVMAFINGVPTQLGTMASGGLLIVASTLSPDASSAIGLSLALVTLVLVVRMRPAYTNALATAVRQGMVDVFAAPLQCAQKPVLDAEGLAALVETLSDPQPGARLLAIRTLGRLQGDSAREQVLPRLTDPDPGVRATALEILASVDIARSMLWDPSSRVRRSALTVLDQHREGLGKEAESVLSDVDPVVRSKAATMVQSERGRSVIDEMLASDDPSHLSAALLALARVPSLSAIPPEDFASHPDRRVRAAAAQAMATRPESIGILEGLLDDSSIKVRSAAASSLASSAPERLSDVLARGSVRASEAALVAMTDAGLGTERLESWIAGEVQRARFLRRHQNALDGLTPGTALDYLRRLLLMRQRRLARWALLAFRDPRLLEMPWVRRGVWSSDPDTRAYSLEALDTFHGNASVRGLIALLEDPPAPEGADPMSSLQELAEDFDDWIRALARRVLEGESENDVADSMSGPMSRWTVHETHLLTPLDRVLALQRVAMFSEVDPEDLEKIALATVERRYEANEVIYHEGDVGDEVLVIVSGEVEIRHGRDEIRSYGAGELVGELAFLRRAPRSADVVAGDDGVQGLVLGSSELQGILEERPEVAMSMLATLAERLGTMGEELTMELPGTPP